MRIKDETEAGAAAESPHLRDITRCVGGASTHSVVEGVLRPSQAAVVATVWLRRDAPCWRVEGSVEGGGGRARRRHLAVDRGGPGLGLLQGEGRVCDPAHTHLLPGCTNIWTETKQTSGAAGREAGRSGLMRSLTCDDLSEFGVQVDRAGQEGADVSASQDGRP